MPRVLSLHSPRPGLQYKHMKLGLPLKLGIAVVLLFAAVIATCLLWTPLRLRYYVSYYYSDDPQEIERGIKGLQSIGIKGVSELEQLTLDELKHDPGKHLATVSDVLISDKPKGIDILARILAGGSEEASFLEKHWACFNAPVKTHEDGVYPLHLAAKKGWKDAAALLLAKGADVDAKADGGFTPLHDAVWEGHEEIAALLIEKGADVNATINRKLITPLSNAISRGYENMAVLLLRKGADVDAKDILGFSPLHHAVIAGHKNLAELLIEKGADVGAKDNYGGTALHGAALDGHIHIADLLIEKGADINTKTTKTGNTPLHTAAREGQKDVTSLLIDKGADVNSKNNSGMTPLHLATQSGYKETIYLLIAKGANENAIDKTGMTPLNWAYEKEVATLLRNNGARKSEELPDGKPFSIELQKVIDNYMQGLKLSRGTSSISKGKNKNVFKISDAVKEKFDKSKALLEKYMQNHPNDSRGKEIMELIDFYLNFWK